MVCISASARFGDGNGFLAISTLDRICIFPLLLVSGDAVDLMARSWSMHLISELSEIISAGLMYCPSPRPGRSQSDPVAGCPARVRAENVSLVGLALPVLCPVCRCTGPAVARRFWTPEHQVFNLFAVQRLVNLSLPERHPCRHHPGSHRAIAPGRLCRWPSLCPVYVPASLKSTLRQSSHAAKRSPVIRPKVGSWS